MLAATINWVVTILRTFTKRQLEYVVQVPLATMPTNVAEGNTTIPASRSVAITIECTPNQMAVPDNTVCFKSPGKSRAHLFLFA